MAGSDSHLQEWTLFDRLLTHFKRHKAQTELLSTQKAMYYATVDHKVVKYLKKGKFDKAYSRLDKMLRGDAKVVSESERASLEHSPSVMSIANELDLGGLHRVQAAWKQEFVGPMEKILRKVVEESEHSFSPDKDYAKILSCVQSSGSGKSRTISEHGLFRVGVVYTFRVGDESGFPPGDVEITQLVIGSVSGRTYRRSMEHATAIGLLSASIESVSKLLNECEAHDRPHFARRFHELMAPTNNMPDSTDDSDSAPAQGLSIRLASTRSAGRITFCRNVVSRTKAIVEEFRQSASWRKLFDLETFTDNQDEGRAPRLVAYDQMSGEELVVERLIRPLAELVTQLQSYGIGHPTNIPIFFAFDEVTNMTDTPNHNPALFALRRVLRLIRKLPVWTFFLSTQQPLKHLVPAPAHDGSWRIRSRVLDRIDPFCSFLVDVQAARRFSLDKAKELSKPVEELSAISHMSAIGRPLWSMFLVDPRIEEGTVRNTVTHKLFTGLDRYDPSLETHLFAVLSNRICIDPCLNRKETIGLEATSVGSHLRWLSHVDAKTGEFQSMTISEPLVSEASTAILVQDSGKGDPWISTIMSMRDKFFSRGLIDRGRGGELVARLLSVYSRDSLFKTAKKIGISESPILWLEEREDDQHKHMAYARPFRVTAYLQAMFTKSNKILDTPAQLHNGKECEGVTVATTFANSVMNFTHFVETNTLLQDNSIIDLLHHLLYSQAALRLAPNQQAWDILIPIYDGDISAPFDTGALGVLLLQVRNRTIKTKLDITHPDPHNGTNGRTMYTGLFGTKMKIISILLDLGIEAAETEVCKSYSKHTFAFRVSGHGADSYKVITPPIESAIRAMLSFDTEELGVQQTIANYNRRFDFHSIESRYPAEPFHDLGIEPCKKHDTLARSQGVQSFRAVNSSASNPRIEKRKKRKSYPAANSAPDEDLESRAQQSKRRGRRLKN